MSNPGRDVRFLVFAGSARKASYNDQLAALAATAVKQGGGTADRGCIADFESPFYNQDDEASTGIPAGIQRFADRLKAADGLIIACPEYNASMPGAVKNLIDWASRIRPQPFNGKQALLLSASPSMMGGNRGLWSLRMPLEHLGTRVYPDMFSLAQAHDAFDPGGRLKDETLQKRFDTSIDCFMELVEAAKHYRGLKTQWVEFLGEKPNPIIDRVESSSGKAA